MLVVAVLCLAVAVGLWSDPATLSRMVVQPQALLALLVADAGLLVFRVVAVVDAYLLASREDRAPAARGGWRTGAAAGMVALLTLTAAPHAAAAYYDLQAYDLLTSVFAGEDPAWQARERAQHHLGNGFVTAVPGRVTVLLLGGDAGPGRHGRRTDTMMVASFELATGKVTLFGLPRNLVQVPLPDGPAADHFSVPLLPAAAQRALRLRRGRAARPVPPQQAARHRRRRRGSRGAAGAAHRPLRPGRPARVRGRGRRPGRGHGQQPEAAAHRDRPPGPRGRPAGVQHPARAQAPQRLHRARLLAIAGDDQRLRPHAAPAVRDRLAGQADPSRPRSWPPSPGWSRCSNAAWPPTSRPTGCRP